MTETPMDVAAGVQRSLTAASRAIGTGIRGMSKLAAKVARDCMDDQARSAAGTDQRFSNFGRAGKLMTKARYDDQGVTIVPVGPWGIPEKGAGAHEMPAWGRGSASHPGTVSKQAKRSWSKGRDATFEKLGREVPKLIEDEVVEAFERA